MDNLVEKVVDKVIDFGISYKMTDKEIVEFNTKVITRLQEELDDFKKYLKEEGDQETCVWCKDIFPKSDLKETSMGLMCEHCHRGVESREGKI